MALQAETKMQLDIMDAIGLSVPIYPALDLVFHVPNGGWRGRVEARLFKGMGVKAGVLDLLLPAPARDNVMDWNGFALELKAPGNKPSVDQVKWARKQEAAGWLCRWTDTASSATQALVWYAQRVTSIAYEARSGSYQPESIDQIDRIWRL